MKILYLYIFLFRISYEILVNLVWVVTLLLKFQCLLSHGQVYV